MVDTQPSQIPRPPSVLAVQGLFLKLSDRTLLKGIELTSFEPGITLVMGANGAGKSLFLRSLHGLLPIEGQVSFAGRPLSETLTEQAMVFQKPTPFPMSIYDNIAFGVKLYESLSKSEMDDRVEWALSKAALWTEVKDKLNQSGLSLSGGQQQRLCIARSVAVKPSVLLLDEPTSALDPLSTAKIEELIDELKHDYTIAIVTHNMQQAARCSDYTAYMYLGEMIEFGATEQIFFKPERKETEDYITGRFG